MHEKTRERIARWATQQMETKVTGSTIEWRRDIAESTNWALYIDNQFCGVFTPHDRHKVDMVIDKLIRK